MPGGVSLGCRPARKNGGGAQSGGMTGSMPQVLELGRAHRGLLPVSPKKFSHADRDQVLRPCWGPAVAPSAPHPAADDGPCRREVADAVAHVSVGICRCWCRVRRWRGGQVCCPRSSGRRSSRKIACGPNVLGPGKGGRKG